MNCKFDYRFYTGRRLKLLVLVLSMLTGHFGPTGLSAQEKKEKYLEQELGELGVKNGVEGLREFFQSYSPDASSKEKVQNLIEQLGSDSFEERTSATNELARISLSDMPLVKAAIDNNDLEVSLRARQVLRMFEKGTHLARLQKVLRVMETHEVKGFLDEVCTSLQMVNSNNLLKIQFEKTMFATSSQKDAEVLQRYVVDENRHSREIYLRVLASLQPGKNLELLSRLSVEEDDVDVKLAAANELAKVPDRRCLQPLIDLLDHPSVRVRSRASLIVRSVTGNQFGYVAVAQESKRSEAIKKWKSWMATSGDEAALFKDSVVRKMYLQRLIVASYSQRKVVEIDLQGNSLRTLPAAGTPMGVCGNATGDVLVCDYSGRKAIVFDAENKVVFEKKLIGGPLSGQLLENGNVLVGTSTAKKVLEFDREGNEVWQATLPGRINVVHRTSENTTLVSMLGEGKVVELDERGKMIFELEVHKPNGVRRLENGNLLVCLYDKGEVCEYDRDKAIVWKATGLTKPARAQRMPDGNTVIYHRGGVCIYDPAQKLVRTIKVKEIKAGDVGSLHFF